MTWIRHFRGSSAWPVAVLVATSPFLMGQANAPGSQAPVAPAHAALSPRTGLTLLDVLQATLQKNPQLKIQHYTVDAQAGAARTARGQFDWTLNASGVQQHSYTPLTPDQAAQYGFANTPGALTTTIANSSLVAASATKEYRNGITLTPSLQATRNTDNLFTQDGVNTAHAGLQVVLPLLRNRGRTTVDAQEIAARTTLEARQMDLSQAVSDTLAAGAAGYWNFVAADATLVVYKDSEARGQDLLSGAKALVDADRLPANDLNAIRANVAQRTASRTAAEQSLLVARQQLVVTMGLAPDQILSLPAPAEDMPDSTPAYDASLLAGYLQMSSTHRSDIAAAKLRKDANQTLENAARNQLKSQFDVTSSLGYTGVRGGTNGLDLPRSIASGAQGADVVVGVTYSKTPANNAARGQLETAVAATRQSDVTLQDTTRVAGTSVVVAYEAIRSTRSQLQKAREAVKFYQAALDGEREKYRLGLNSLIDVLTVEDRLTTGVLAEVNARLAYAQALVQMRQSTGTIVQAGQDVQVVDPLLFSTLP